MDTSKVSSEIWLQAFSYLSKTSLKAIRLGGNRYLETLASTLLFTTAYIATRTGVLDTFVTLATHPEFKHHIKKVVYDTSRFNDAVVTKYAKDPIGPALKALYQDQENIQGDHFSYCLEKAFRCLSSIQEVHVADISRSALLPGDQNSALWDRNHLEALLLARIVSQSLPSNIACPSLKKMEDPPIMGIANGFKRECQGFFIFMQVLSKYSLGTLEYLSLGNGVNAARNGGITQHLFTSLMDNRTLQIFGPVCGTLRKLDLTVSLTSVLYSKYQNYTVGCSNPFYGTTVANHGDARFRVKLQSFLRSAENLEELRLACNRPYPTLSLEDTLVGHTWSKLRKLHIQYFKGKAGELEDIIYHHAGTVRYMSIDDFWLTSGSWKAFVAGLPALAPCLKICFGGLAFQGQIRKQLYHLDQDLMAISTMNEVEAEIDIHFQEPLKWIEGRGDDTPRSDSDSGSGDLEYDSDGSTPSGAAHQEHELRSESFDLMLPSFQRKISWLEGRIPGHPLLVYYVALQGHKGDHEAARKALFQQHIQIPKLELKYPDFRKSMHEIQTEMPFLVEDKDCIWALEEKEGDVDDACELICEINEIDKSRPNPKYTGPKYI